MTKKVNLALVALLTSSLVSGGTVILANDNSAVKVGTEASIVKDEVTFWRVKDILKLGYTQEQDGYLSYIKNGSEKIYLTMYNSIDVDGEIYVASNTLKQKLGLNVSEIDGKSVILDSPLPPDKHITYMKYGDLLEMDIDGKQTGGDKELEKISVSKVSEDSEEYCVDYEIKVDDASLRTSITSPTDSFVVAEVSDGNYVIALSGTGMSSDCYTEFYQYLPETSSVKNIGTIEGLVLGGMSMKDGMQFNFEDSSVTTENRLDVVHTGWYKASYKFGALGEQMQMDKKDFYSVNETPLTLKMDFSFLTSPREDATTEELLTGTNLEFTETDNLYWAKFIANGKELYLRLAYDTQEASIEEFHYSSSFYNPISMTPIFAEDLFEGLFYAD